MDIILLQDVDSLGNAGEIVKVKPGYARNYLFAKGLAVRSSKKNRALVNEKKSAIKARALRDAKINQDIETKLNKKLPPGKSKPKAIPSFVIYVR